MATPSYKDLTAQIAKLQQEADAARQEETKTVIAQIHHVMAQYGITSADLGLKGTRAKRKGSTAVIKFQDPETGATWTGRGRAPAWIAGKDRSKYAVC